MAYAFRRGDATVQDAVRRIARELVAETFAALADEGRPLAGRIHTGRKAVKKLRGLIRLVRPGFPAYGIENAALREAGWTIRAPREAEVMLATFDRMVEAAGLSQDGTAGLRGPFVAARGAALAPEALAADLAAFRDALGEVAGRADRWEVSGKGFGTLEKGLARTWEAAQAAMEDALADPQEDAVHTWRKRVKDHWYQARLLRPINPAAMDPHIAEADALGELLGEHNDLAVLGHRLPSGDAAAARIAEAAHDRQAAILAEAGPRCRLLLAGPAEALTARWRAWWKLWRG